MPVVPIFEKQPETTSYDSMQITTQTTQIITQTKPPPTTHELLPHIFTTTLLTEHLRSIREILSDMAKSLSNQNFVCTRSRTPSTRSRTHPRTQAHN
jgi:nitrous oxide reductase accessory protein NosL